MARGKSRLQLHHTINVSAPRKFATLSKTSTQIRKVLTSTSAPSPNITGTEDNPDELPTVPTFDFEPELNPTIIDYPAGLHVKPKAKRYQNSDAPLLTWREYRQEYLDLVLILDGRGRHKEHCPGCQGAGPTFRCRDCFGHTLYCKSCIIRRHHDRPLHVLEEWSNTFFRKVTLQYLGLRVQLGHQQGVSCPFQSRGHKDFAIIDINGIHTINIDFCACDNALPFRNQLLEVGWWPSTPLEPQSAATMRVLRSFQYWNLQGHLSPTDFYRGLEQMTCGDGLTHVPDRLAQWMLLVREWRHIKMTKRAGRGHDPSGVEKTAQGALSIPCRACPHPNINLPVGWEDAPPEVRWQYTLILAEDANFKQKARLRSDGLKDPPLGPGWATFVQNDAYLRHVAQFADQDEISHCVGFAALWKANNKGKGLRATGIGSVSCARHEMYRPNGMGDLQKGERYSNMDYIFLASIVGTLLQLVTISYDIACQWGINFFARMNAPTMPEALRIPASTVVTYYVPKFHLQAHNSKCHAPFSFNFGLGVGRTDGEGVERNWSLLNGIAPSVSMMGPGGRWDTLDDVCNYGNWRKTVGLPSSLLRKMSLAIPQAVIHHRAFMAFTESLQHEHATDVVEWEKKVRQWELDHNLPCPYNVPDQKITFAEVKRRLSEEEHRQVESGESLLSLDDMSPSTYIIAMLEIEELQQILLIDIKALSQTTTQKTTIQRRRTNLLRRIQNLTSVQTKYMPGLMAYLEGIQPGANSLPTSTPELIPLHLPSSLPAEKRHTVCVGGIDRIEDELRFAQAFEALTRLRCQLTKRTYASRYKVRNVSSQRHYTRFRTLQDHTESKIKAARLQYTTTRNALFSLRGPGSWEDSLQILRLEDVRGMNEKAILDEERHEMRQTRVMAGLDEDPTAGENSDIDYLPETVFNPHLRVGEGHRTLSWIWYSTTSEEVDHSAFTEAYLRVEWLKCRARAARWKEEVRLLDEEMRRSIEFCMWKARWWRDRLDCRPSTTPHLAEGITAYAAEHAAAEQQRAISWSTHWVAIRQRATMVLERHLVDQEDPTDFAALEIEVEDDEDEENMLFDDLE